MKKMRTKFAVRALAAALVATFSLGAVAQANTGYNVGTSLTIGAPSLVKKGRTFKISGTLSSSKQYCRKNSEIKIIKVGSGVIGTTTTGGQGNFSFNTKIRKAQRFRAKFAGKSKGVHPNIHVCRASTSNTIKVKVHH